MTQLASLVSGIALVLGFLASPPAFGQMATTTATSSPPYDVTTAAGYREWAIRYAAAACGDSVTLPTFDANPPGGLPAVTNPRDAEFAWRLEGEDILVTGIPDGVYALTSACLPGLQMFCYSGPPYTDTFSGGQVGLGMSCAQLRLPPLDATVQAGGWTSLGSAQVRIQSLPPGYSRYGEPPPPTPPPTTRRPTPPPDLNPKNRLNSWATWRFLATAHSRAG